MLSYLARTPFGARTMSHAQIAAQKAADATAPDAIVHKWTILREISIAKERLGLSDRALSILDALLSFHPDVTLSGAQLVVWPSNAQLRLRAHGISEPTLRRHLAQLVEAGIIVRRDSPNGKRYARKGRGGEIEQAFGFDLTPLVARAAEFGALADTVRAQAQSYRLARERVTLCRRDIVKLLALSEGGGVSPEEISERSVYRSLIESLGRSPPLERLEAVACELTKLASAIYDRLEQLNGNPPQNERHIQSSKTETSPESEQAAETVGEWSATTSVLKFRPRRDPYPLSMVLDACPDIVDYSKGGIDDWPGLERAAALIRPILGISPSAYAEAQEVLGARSAAIVVAAILQRAQAIQSPGAYLRSLVRKAQIGSFSVGPMLMALIAARARPRRA